MAAEWPKMTLQEANVALIDCDHRTPPAAGAGYPYIAIPQLRGGRIDVTDARRITREHYLEWTRKAKPSAHDVILSRRCNPGETAVASPHLEFALGQNLVLLRSDGTKVYPPFLRWLVRGPEWWEQIGKFINVGAVFDSLRCADVPQFELHIPPIAEQRAIASILGTLDDRIDVSRQINETLEAMALALFKSWFVDFDPVRAKAKGREPGIPKSIAGLFPDRFEDSELGEIPAGWAVGPILEQAEVLSGGTPKTDRPDYWNGGIPWASAKDVSQCVQAFLVATERTITEKGLAESATQMIPCFSTVIVARGATTGRMVMLGREMAMNQTCYALASKSKAPFALHCQLRQKIDELVHAAHGSVFDTITISTLKSARFILPPPNVLAGFEKFVSPLFERILANCEESRTLSELRDTLLPQLLSGAIRVRLAERAVENAL